jgi:hypothetical protein
MFESLQLNSDRLLLGHLWIDAVVADCHSAGAGLTEGALAIALCCAGTWAFRSLKLVWMKMGTEIWKRKETRRSHTFDPRLRHGTQAAC